LRLSFALYNNPCQNNCEDFTTVDLNSLFNTANWPKLEEVSLYGAHLSQSVASQFLAAHPSISAFSVYEATTASQFIKSEDFEVTNPKPPSGLSFPSETLANIIHIRAPDYLTRAILSSPTSSPRPLQHLSIELKDEASQLLGGLSSLRGLSIGTTTPQELISLATILPEIVNLGTDPVSPGCIFILILLRTQFTEAHVILDLRCATVRVD